MTNDIFAQQRAYWHVKDALRRGALSRPAKCENCGTDPGLMKNKKSKIQAHHEDYNKPFDVKWLCVKCHIAVTPRNNNCTPAPRFGVMNNAAKLSAENVLFIKKSPLSGRKLALLFGVNASTVHRVRSGRNWAKLEDGK